MIEKYLSRFETVEGTTIEAIEAVSKRVSFVFPLDYVHFILKSNGGEGHINNSYLILWNIEDLMDSITYYDYEGLIFFGSTAGDDGFAFNRLNNTIVEIAFIDIGCDEPVFCANTFEGFLEHLYNQD